MTPQLRSLAAGFFLAAAIPGGAFAQGSPPARLDLRIGQRVWVTTDDGVESSGRVAHLTAAGIALDLASAPTPWARVRTIQVPDRLENGMLLGAGIGFAALGGAAALVTDRACANEGGRCGLETIGRLGVFGIVGAGAGTGIGALIDALAHHRQTIYRRSITIAAGAAASRESRGATVSIRW